MHARGDRAAEEEETRNLHLLQVTVWLGLEAFWQNPFHLDGTGPSPRSLKLSDSGQTPARDFEGVIRRFRSCSGEPSKSTFLAETRRRTRIEICDDDVSAELGSLPDGVLRDLAVLLHPQELPRPR